MSETRPIEAFAARLSVIVIGVLLVVLGGTVSVAAIPAARAWLAGEAPRKPTYVVGDRLALPGTDAQKVPVRVVVFFRADCPASQRSRGRFKDLAAAEQQTPVAVTLVTTPHDPGPARAFAESVGVAASDLVVADMAALPVRVVPSVAVVDAADRIAYFREGEVDAAAMEEIRQAVRRVTAGLD